MMQVDPSIPKELTVVSGFVAPPQMYKLFCKVNRYFGSGNTNYHRCQWSGKERRRRFRFQTARLVQGKWKYPMSLSIDHNNPEKSNGQYSPPGMSSEPD